MKINKKLFHLTLLLIVLSSGCLQEVFKSENPDEKNIVPVPYPEEAKSTLNPIPVTEQTISVGKEKYEIFCSMCHGSMGRGAEEVTKSLQVTPSSLVNSDVKKRSDGELFWASSNGVNGTLMLPWNEILSDAEIWLIVNYIRVLQEES
jgi:mono/diheme cytochrome c family protein